MTGMGTMGDNREIAIDDPRLRKLYAYWCMKRGKRAMPARKDIDPLDVRELMGNLTLIDVRPEPAEFRFRLAGTRIVDLFGKELTGRNVDEARFLGKRPPFERQCGAVLESKEPSFIIILMGVEHRRMVYRQLLLPLSSDGENIDIMLGGAVFAPATMSSRTRNAISEA